MPHASPPSGKRRRPYDAIYSLEDRPPNLALSMLSLQHVATALPSLLLLLALAHVTGVSVETMPAILSATLLGMAVSTVLQAWGGRWGSGVFLVHSVEPALITVAAAAMAISGPGALATISFVAAITALGVSPILPKLRALFPTSVVGTILCMDGMYLVAPAFKDAWGLNARMQVDLSSVLISTSALATIVALSIWGTRRLQLIAVVTGLVVGVTVAAVLGQVQGASTLTDTPWLGLPHLAAPSLHVPPALLIAAAITSLMNQLENMGGAVVLDRMTDADWKRPNALSMSNAVRAGGLGNLVAACFGGAPNVYDSDNVALASASKATSRYIGFATAAVFLGLAFLPKCIALVALIPTALSGGLAVYTALFLMVTGIEMATERPVDHRATFSIGLALAAGLAVMVLPGISQNFPKELRFIAENSFVVTGIVVVLLNWLFQLGTKQRVEGTLTADDRPVRQQAVEFIERQGGIWSARRDVLQRAISASLEAIEAIAASGGRRPVRIRGFFDEYNLNIELVHTGDPIALEKGPGLSQAQADHLLHADITTLDIDLALQQVGSAILHHLADKVSAEGAGTLKDPAFIRLHFEH